MTVMDRDIEALLATACDDQDRPLSFGVDDVVRRGRRRSRIRRTATVTATAVATGALVATGAVLVEGAQPATGRDAPVAGRPAAVTAVPPVIADDTWVRLADNAWFRIGAGGPGHYGLGAAGVHAVVTDRPREYDGKGPFFGWAIENDRPRKGYLMDHIGRDTLRELAIMRGDIRSAEFTVKGANGTVHARAKIYRLATLPGWVLAVSDPFQRPQGHSVKEQTVNAYGANGDRLLQCSRSGSGETCHN